MAAGLSDLTLTGGSPSTHLAQSRRHAVDKWAVKYDPNLLLQRYLPRSLCIYLSLNSILNCVDDAGSCTQSCHTVGSHSTIQHKPNDQSHCSGKDIVVVSCFFRNLCSDQSSRV